MRKINMVDVYEMIMKLKKELEDDLKRIKHLSLKDKKINYESYAKFKISTQIKLETLDQVLKELEQLETIKEVEK